MNSLKRELSQLIEEILQESQTLTSLLIQGEEKKVYGRMAQLCDCLGWLDLAAESLIITASVKANHSDEKSLVQARQGLVVVLKQLTSGIEKRDTVDLSDCLKFELPDCLNSWKNLFIDDGDRLYSTDATVG